MQKRILAIGHDAYRAGAQIALLRVLRWLRANHDAEISLMLGAGGELLADYTKLLPTSVLGPAVVPSDTSIPRRQVWQRRRVRRQMFAPGSFDLIYANSCASASLAIDIAAMVRCPALCHVHELEQSIHRFCGQFGSVSRRLDGFIAVSRAVEQNLVLNHRIDKAKIDVISGTVPLPPKESSAADRSRLRTELGIPPDAFVVGGSGTLDWRKGPDVFLLVARGLAQRLAERRFHFVWVGGDWAQLDMMQHEVERLGVGDTVSFVGQRAEPAPFFELFDTFLLSSREDPFPLVCLEAAALGAPIVCFADAGGMPEFVEDDAGYVLPYLDIEATVDCLAQLANSPATAAALGRRAAQKVQERCSLDVIGPQIAAVLDRHLKQGVKEPAKVAEIDERAGI